MYFIKYNIVGKDWTDVTTEDEGCFGNVYKQSCSSFHSNGIMSYFSNYILEKLTTGKQTVDMMAFAQ